jgi:phage terminase large subunit-like protein
MAEQSLAERVAGMDEARRKAILSALSPKERSQLTYLWRWWARPSQIEPAGDWRTWLILAGRGFGKTRSGAEWVRAQVEAGRCGRIALVAATAADARDVVVEGESGILAISPPTNRPLYEPSKRRLTWHNGAIATTYSADEPDRLRGPQHDGAWCLVGETVVAMADGMECPIRDVNVGDVVATPGGPRRVLASAMTRRQAEVVRMRLSDGGTVIGTADHPVFVHDAGFVPMGQLQPGTRCSVLATGNTVVAVDVATVESLGEPRDVFDIAVEGARAFFANGVLVHNCDELGAWRYSEAWDQLQFGLRLGEAPRAVVTTTPRPTPLIRALVASKETAVTRGSSFENAANLAATFIADIERRYAGTRLGRQELFAEILSDLEGALFKRELIKYGTP